VSTVTRKSKALTALGDANNPFGRVVRLTATRNNIITCRCLRCWTVFLARVHLPTLQNVVGFMERGWTPAHILVVCPTCTDQAKTRADRYWRTYWYPRIEYITLTPGVQPESDWAVQS
jgi:hypothetical protein